MFDKRMQEEHPLLLYKYISTISAGNPIMAVKHNILYIDIDDCFKTTAFDIGSHYADILDLKALGLLNFLCSQIPNCRIVITSSWRADGKESLQTYFEHSLQCLKLISPDLVNHIHFFNIDEESWRIPIDNSTSSNPLVQKRGPQNQQHIDRYKKYIDQYAIIDDDCAKFDERNKAQIKRFIQIQSPHDGFSMTDLNKTLTLFNLQPIE